MKLSEYFEIRNPTYIILKLKPTTDIEDANSEKIGRAIASLYKTVVNRIVKEQKKYVLQASVKVSYYITLTKKEISFFFIIPSFYETVVREKIRSTWRNITLDVVKTVPNFDNTSISYKIKQKNESPLSFRTTNNTLLLRNMVNITSVLDTNDKVGVFYNFIPISNYSWTSECKETLERVRNGLSIGKDKFTFDYIIKACVAFFTNLGNDISDFANEFMSGITDVQLTTTASSLYTKPQTRRKTNSLMRNSSTPVSSHSFYDDRPILGSQMSISSDSRSKMASQVLGMQCIVMSQSDIIGQAINNAESTIQCFRILNGDNEIVADRYNNHNFCITDKILPDVEMMTVSPKECNSFISLPDQRLLEQYDNIQCNDTYESKVAKELTKGYMNLGRSKYRGQEVDVFTSSDANYKNLAHIICGSNRSGKSTLMSNMMCDAVKSGNVAIALDFCGNCKLTSDVERNLRNTLIIDCSDIDNLQSLAYNEVPDSDNSFKQYENAKIQATQILSLINVNNKDDRALSIKMHRYLEAAAIITFLSSTSINDVFNVLQNHIARQNAIVKAQNLNIEYVDEYIYTLEELNNIKNGECIGTNSSLIVGILDRITTLKSNVYVELMLKQSAENNINLLDEIQKSQLISIKIPEHLFTTQQQKDSYCCYWMSKILLSLKLRNTFIPNPSDRKQACIFIDELYQCKNLEEEIKKIISQLPKMTCKLILSCHYIGQLSILREELRSVNASYTLISGSDRRNFEELKSELYPYTEKDLLRLKRYNALHLIKCNKGYQTCTTILPSPLKEL